LEYAHFPDKSNANKFVIISQNPIDNENMKYLESLRKLYNIPIYYRQFDVKNNELLKDEY